MEFSTDSISNEISKIEVQELSISQAAVNEIKLRRESGRKPESISNEEITKGNLVLNTYTVLDDAVHGGMGSVWRVHHNGWNADLAMKRPQPRFFAEGSEARKEGFIRECENWINLGLHPDIVSCYYVREIGGIPTIFSEWMDNGSLKDRIRDGSLYEGTEERVQARILDIAIRTAEGLKYSHENGLIHQDVKPGNILLTEKWDAKVADFGLAKAKSRLTRDEKPVSSGYTPEYCPGEQAEGAPAEKWMDVYAWALTVLEMFAGRRLWAAGAEAKEQFDAWPVQCRIALPEELKDFLGSCLKEKKDDFAAAKNALKAVYNTITGREYKSIPEDAATETANSLNNKALSFLDLNYPETALSLWEQSLKTAPGHFASVYNLHLYLMRSGREDDLTAVENVANALKESSSQAGIYAAMLALERMKNSEAETYLKQSLPEASEKEAWMGVHRACEEYAPLSIVETKADRKPGFGWFTPTLTADGRHILFANHTDRGVRCSVLDAATGEEIRTAEFVFPAQAAGCRAGMAAADDQLNGIGICMEERSGVSSSGKRYPDFILLCSFSTGKTRLLKIPSSCAKHHILRMGFTESADRFWIVFVNGDTLMYKVYPGVSSSACQHIRVLKRDVSDENSFGFCDRSGRLAVICDCDLKNPGRSDRVWLTDPLRGRILWQADMPDHLSAVSLSVENQMLLLVDREKICHFYSLSDFREKRSVRIACSGTYVHSLQMTKNGGMICCGDYLGVHDAQGRCIRSFGYRSHRPWDTDSSGETVIAETDAGFIRARIPQRHYAANWYVSRPLNFSAMAENESEFLHLIGQAEKDIETGNPESAIQNVDKARSVYGFGKDPRIHRINCLLASQCRKTGIYSINSVRRSMTGIGEIALDRDGRLLLLSENRILRLDKQSVDAEELYADSEKLCFMTPLHEYGVLFVRENLPVISGIDRWKCIDDRTGAEMYTLSFPLSERPSGPAAEKCLSAVVFPTKKGYVFFDKDTGERKYTAEHDAFLAAYTSLGSGKALVSLYYTGGRKSCTQCVRAGTLEAGYEKNVLDNHVLPSGLVLSREAGAGDLSARLVLWDPETSETLGSSDETGRNVVFVSADGEYALCKDQHTGRIELWSVSALQKIFEYQADGVGSYNAVVLSADNMELYCCDKGELAENTIDWKFES